MKATGILSKEHRAIEYLLAAIEMQAARLQSGAAARTEFFLDALVFLREFVDERHAQKEEDTLLVVLMDAGSPKDGAPIATVLADHARARDIVRNIEKNAQIVLGGGAGARADLARDAIEYVSLLTRHIRTEESELFPLAEQMIPAGAAAELDAEFDRIENAYLDAGIHDTYYGIAEKLAEEAAS